MHQATQTDFQHIKAVLNPPDLPPPLQRCLAKSCGVARDLRKNLEYFNNLETNETGARPKRGHQALPMYKGDTNEAEPQGQEVDKFGRGAKDHRGNLEFPHIPEAKDTRVLLEAPPCCRTSTGATSPTPTGT